MPRRKPVNPQPKLKQEDEKEEGKVGRRAGENDDGEPLEKKALTETSWENGANCDQTYAVNTVIAELESEDRKTLKYDVSQGDAPEIVIKPDVIKQKTQNKVTGVVSTSVVGQSSSVMKCNQSLQALFDAAHSELENISKQGDSDVDSATRQTVMQVTVPKASDLTSALKTGQLVIIQCDTLEPDKKAAPQVIQQIVVNKESTNKLQLPAAAMSNIKLVAADKPSDHVYGSTVTEMTLGDSFSYNVNKTLKPMDGKPMCVLPRLATETIMAMQMPVVPSVGRKRKHPQKPGKHICPYCSRGCAKPSVLQKHIRAHTGERPYPCTPCGFSFKTKSNLYKHCNSRAHAIKVGQLTGASEKANDSAPKEAKGAMILDGPEEEMIPESAVVEERIESIVPKMVQGVQQKVSGVKSGVQQTVSGAGGDSQIIVVQPECAVVETMTSRSSGASAKEVVSDCQFYDVTFVTSDGTLQTLSLPAQLAMPVVQSSQVTTTAATTTSQVIIIRNTDEKPAVNINAQVEMVASPVTTVAVSPPSFSDYKLYDTAAVKSNIKITQLTRQMLCSSQVQLTPTVLPSGDPPAASSTSQTIPRAGLTPEMLNERITQLISSNAAIVDVPMADAPRPKRLSRHNSMFEPMLLASPQVTIATAPILLNTSTSMLPFETARKTTKLPQAKSDGGLFLGQVEPADQPPGDGENPPGGTSGPGLTFTTSVATNEIKIQIRLPKPATTTGTTVSVVSVTGAGQVHGVTTPGMAVERSVIKDLLLKGRSLSLPSNVELVPPGGTGTAGDTASGDTASGDTAKSMMCTSCLQTFCNASVLDEHNKQSCSVGGAAKPGQVIVVTAPKSKLACPGVVVTTSVATSSVVTPSIATATKTHTVVMTTAMTGGSTMLLEVVDPTVPPKRGRPKGSRNSYNSIPRKPSPVPDPSLFPTYPSLAPRPPNERQADSVTLKPPGRPPRPVLRLKIPPPHGFTTNHVTKGSQSAGVSPGSLSDLPTTPITSFAKLKLKGKILMKRSMSVERMLLQDKSSSSAGSAGSVGSAMPLSCVQSAAMRQKFLPSLRRCESLDESVPLAKRARLQEHGDGGRLDSLLYKMLMKGLTSSTPAGSTSSFMLSPISMATKSTTPSTTEGNAPDVIIIDDGPTEDNPHTHSSSINGATLVVFTVPPTNVGMTVAARLAAANVAPFARGISADVMLHFPSVESLPDNLVSGIPGLLLRVVTGTTDRRHSLARPDADGAVQDRTRDSNTKAESEQCPIKISDSVKTAVTETNIKAETQELAIECSVIERTGAADKAGAMQLLLSHSYPILCNRTHVTFCTVLKPQPAYIRQLTSDLSMYSNWSTTVTDASESDLTSRMMLSLYETRRRTDVPTYANSSHSVSVLTHSSYWNGISPPPPAPPIVTARHSVRSSSELKLKSSNEPDLISVALNEVEVTCENILSETVPSGSRIVRLLHESVASPVDQPKRVVIFSGGYKTSEEYVYVRGRGRGHYVCEQCGIRCKKPSMLKKHIRTHTNLRPYHCYYCSFSFKTKGNLTKHMKSKAHHKKCLELGIFPIPTIVDETHIDSSTLDQQNQVAEESRILGLSTDDTDGSHATDDNDGDDDDNGDDDDDDDDDDDTESEADMVIVDEADSSRPDVQYVAMVPDCSTEATFLKMKPGSRVELDRTYGISGSTKYMCQVKGQPPRASIDKEIAASLLDLSKGTDEVCKMTATTAEYGLGFAHSTSGQRGLVGQMTTVTWNSGHSPPLINPQGGASASAECYLPPAGGATEGVQTTCVGEVRGHVSPTTQIWLDDMRASWERSASHQPVAEHDCNIGARFVPPLPLGGIPVKMSIQAADITNVQQPVMSSVKGGPIIGHFIKQDVSLASILSLTMTDTVSSAMALPVTVTRTTAVMSQTYCVTSVIGGASMSTAACDSSSGKSPASVDSVSQKLQHAWPDDVEKATDSAVVMSDSITTVATQSVATTTTAIPAVAIGTVTTAITQPTQTIPFHLLGLHGLPAVVPSEIPLGVLLVTTASTTPLTSSSTTVVQFVTGDNRAPYEIIPIPGRVNDNSASLVDGKYVCHVCGKTFPKQHQLTLHKNIHYFERPFKCTECSLSFRTKGHLEKHHKSEGHQLKVSERSQPTLVAVTGAGSTENPRPFRCDDCNVAFRIHGHLAKHLRSKLHIMMLEKLGKVPPGSYALIEKNGSFKEIVATESESSLRCIRQLLKNLEAGVNTSHGEVNDDSETHIPVEISQSAVPEVGQTDCVSERAGNSFAYSRPGEFEKVTNASNDRVTVERKAELIYFGGFVPETEAVSQLAGEGTDGQTGRDAEGSDEDDGTGSSITTTASEPVEHQCSLCSSAFSDVSSLKRHLVTHTELRPHVCEYCDAGFTTAQSLTFHLRTHTQERPYLCGKCGDTFAHLSQLQQHSLIHTSQSLGGTASHSPGSTTSRSPDDTTSQAPSGTTSPSIDGAISQPPGGATESVAAVVTTSVCQQVAIAMVRVETVLSPSGGESVKEVPADDTGDVRGQRDVSDSPGPAVDSRMTNCVGAVTSHTTESTASQLANSFAVTSLHGNSGTVTNSNTATVDAHECPASIAMTAPGGGMASETTTSLERPSENHMSTTPSNPALKRRCLQRQCAMTGEDITVTTVVTSSSDGIKVSCVTAAAIVATPIDDTERCSSSQHSNN